MAKLGISKNSIGPANGKSAEVKWQEKVEIDALISGRSEQLRTPKRCV